jgi:hypothetical protein
MALFFDLRLILDFNLAALDLLTRLESEPGVSMTAESGHSLLKLVELVFYFVLVPAASDKNLLELHF